MIINEKVAYLKGLIEGANFDTNTTEGKLISEILRFKVLCKRVLRGGTFSRILNIFKYTTECGSVYD